MKLKVITSLVSTLFLFSMLTLAFNVQPVRASGTIYIRADGSIDPPTANITSTDNITYTFTHNNYDSIVIERDNIVLDGAGYTLQSTGVYTSRGIDLTGRSNITIKNMTVTTFGDGIYLNGASYNNIVGNNITNNNNHGIYFHSSSNNIVSGNNITNNRIGIVLAWYAANNNDIFRNNIINSNLGISLSFSCYNNKFYHNNVIGHSRVSSGGGTQYLG